MTIVDMCLDICVDTLGSKTYLVCNIVFPRMCARGAHLKVGLRGEALFRGGGGGVGDSFKNEILRVALV